MGNNDNIKDLIRVIAGGYLIYLGIKLAMDMANGESDPNYQIVFIAAIVIFIAAGAWILFTTAKAFIAANKAGQSEVASEAEEADSSETEEADEEAAPEAEKNSND